MKSATLAAPDRALPQRQSWAVVAIAPAPAIAESTNTALVRTNKQLRLTNDSRIVHATLLL